MTEFLSSGRNWEHVLAILLLLARMGDVGSTYLVSPTLALEANPIARKLGWRFAWLTLLICFVPYFNTVAGLVAIVVSLFVTASNLSRGWVVRALGEAEYLRVLQRAAGASPLRVGIAFVIASAGTFASAGLMLLVISDGPETWPYWFAVGVMIYALAMAVHGCGFLRRLYRHLPRAGR